MQIGSTMVSAFPAKHPCGVTTHVAWPVVEGSTRTTCSGLPTRRANVDQRPSLSSLSALSQHWVEGERKVPTSIAKGATRLAPAPFADKAEAVAGDEVAKVAKGLTWIQASATQRTFALSHNVEASSGAVSQRDYITNLLSDANLQIQSAPGVHRILALPILSQLLTFCFGPHLLYPSKGLLLRNSPVCTFEAQWSIISSLCLPIGTPTSCRVPYGILCQDQAYGEHLSNLRASCHLYQR